MLSRSPSAERLHSVCVKRDGLTITRWQAGAIGLPGFRRRLSPERYVERPFSSRLPPALPRMLHPGLRHQVPTAGVQVRPAEEQPILGRPFCLTDRWQVRAFVRLVPPPLRRMLGMGLQRRHCPLVRRCCKSGPLGMDPPALPRRAAALGECPLLLSVSVAPHHQCQPATGFVGTALVAGQARRGARLPGGPLSSIGRYCCKSRKSPGIKLYRASGRRSAG